MLFSKRGAFVDKIESLGVETAVLPYQAVMLKRLANPAVFWKTMKASRDLYRLLKGEDVALVYCSDVLALVLVAFPVLWLRLPLVYSVIFLYEWPRIILLNILSLMVVDRIVANSNAVKHDLTRRSFFLSQKIETIFNGVDASLFRPLQKDERNVVREELKLDRRTHVVGMVGRFDPAKGHSFFLKAAARLLETRSDVAFVIIGGLLNADAIPSLRQYYRSILEEHQRLDLGDRVRFLDHRDDMPEVMRSLDVLVCPSVSEGFGLVVLEGLASGIPVVLSPAVGALDVVRDTPGVFVAEVADPDSFAVRIAEAIDESGRNGALPIRQAAEPVLRGCSWHEYAHRMEHVYESLVTS
jgi:glycosyltransferase involved in cell wall biosynthesis